MTITNVAGNSIATAGPATVPADGDTIDSSVALTTTPQPTASQVAGYNVSITGP